MISPATVLDLKIAPKELEIARINYVFGINTAQETILDHIKTNCARPYTRLETRAARRPAEAELSICGSAPSLLTTCKTITGPVMACNAAVGVLKDKGIPVDYAMIWDASPEMVRHVRDMPGTTWLIASRVDPFVLEELENLGQDIVLWHAADADQEDSGRPGPESRLLIDLRENTLVIGGRQAATRAPFLALHLGLYDLHFHGVDSSISSDTHVGGSVRKEEEVLVTVDRDHVYRSTFWMASQAEDWQNVILPLLTGNGVRITVHGTGLLPYVHERWMHHNAHGLLSQLGELSGSGDGVR